MSLPVHDLRHQGGRVRPHGAGPVGDAFRRPFQVLLMSLGEVGRLGDVIVLAGGAAMQGDPLALEDDLHHTNRHLDLHQLLD